MSALNPYNVPNADVAQVLEDAADLYESEKVEWCTRIWASVCDEGLSACAEGAILLARGHEWQTVWSAGSRIFDEDLLAKAANRALLYTVNEDRLSRDLNEVPYTYRWNDLYIGDRPMVEVEDRSVSGVMVKRQHKGPPDKALAKSEVIEMMKRAAKDLRNS